jgi:type VI secretion system protein ImpJ
MANARELPEAIQWYEGMLLAPQHFQQTALRQEMLLQYHTALTNPFFWGVRYITFDSLLLFSGKLRITDLEAVMPDGLIVGHPFPGSDPLEVDLQPYLEDLKQKPLTIHLAVPALRPGISMMKGDLERYDSVEGMPVTDENTGDNELEIPRRRPRLTLLVGDTTPQKFISFPIAKVQYKSDTFSLTEFVPPQLAISIQSTIGTLVSGVAKRLREKASSLSEKVRSPSASFSSHYVIQTKELIQAMVEALPYLEGVLTTGVAHPYQLYLALCMVAGHSALLGSGLVPPAFMPYNHNDPLPCFIELCNFVQRMVKEGILESHKAVYFNLDNGIFSLKLEPEWLKVPLSIGIRGQAGMVERDIVSWMESAIIGSHPKIQSLRERRILGAQRKRIDRDEDLMPPLGMVLFSLVPDKENVLPDDMLEILNTADRPGSLRPSEMILYIRKKENEE